MKELRPASIWPLLALVFFSGAAALGIEVAAARVLGRILGSTSESIAGVLIGVLGGMGLGALLVAPWVIKVPRPLVGYAACELVACLVAVLFLAAAPSFTTLLRLPGGSALVVVAVALVTVPWGATLPFLMRVIDNSPRLLRAIYGWNAVGGALGALLGGLVGIPWLGEWGVVLVGGSLQVLVALGAVAWRVPSATFPAELPAAIAVEQASPPRRSVTAFTSRPAALLFVTGFVVLYWEVLWTRLLTLTVGSTVYSFAMITAAVVLGTGLGSLLAPLPVWGRGLPLLATIFCAFLHPLVPYFAEAYLFGVRTVGSSPLLWGTLAAGSVAFVPNFLLGSLFPWGLAQAPERVGRLYAWNALGCIAGALVGGPWGAQVLGLEPAYALGVVGLSILSLSVLAAGTKPAPRMGVLAVLILGAVFLPVGVGAWTAWDPLRLVSGVYQWSRTDLENLTAASSRASRQALYIEAGHEVIVTVELESEANTVFVRGNGKVEGGVPVDPTQPSLADLPTQILLGALPARLLTRQRDRTALLIGFGSGVTFGALTEAPQGFPLGAVDVIEVEAAFVRAVTDVSTRDYFKPFLPPEFFASAQNLPTRFHFGDARRLLAVELGNRQWDAIVSQPSEPWLPGAAPLFTLEFFAAAAGHLRPAGVFLQWLQLYKLGWEDVLLALRTFRRVFPTVFVVRPPGTGEIILVGSNEPRNLAELLVSPLSEKELLTGMELPLDRLAIFVLGPHGVDELVGLARHLPVNTDSRGELEYQVARWLYAATDSARDVLRRLQASGGRDLVSSRLPPAMRNDQAFLRELAARNVRLGDFAEALKILEGDATEAAGKLRREIDAEKTR